MVMAMGRSRQTLCARYNDFKCPDAPIRVFSCDQKANHERSQSDSLVGRIDAEIERLLCPLSVSSRDSEAADSGLG